MQINGVGKATPVADAATLIQIVWILPGRTASEFRRQCADLICRILGGDRQVAAAIEKQHELVKGTPEEAFLLGSSSSKAIVSPAVDNATSASRAITAIKGVNGIVGHNMCGICIVQYGLKLSITQWPKGKEGAGVPLGYGFSKRAGTRRTEHEKDFGDCDILDFVPTPHRDAETDFGEVLRTHKLLCKGRGGSRSRHLQHDVSGSGRHGAGC